MIVSTRHPRPSLIEESDVIGGRDARTAEFPYVVSIAYSFISSFNHVCAGSIIRPNYILSAGSCYTDVPLGGSHIVVAGITDFREERSERWQTRNVIEIKVHPDYKGGVTQRDIALVSLYCF